MAAVLVADVLLGYLKAELGVQAVPGGEGPHGCSTCC